MMIMMIESSDDLDDSSDEDDDEETPVKKKTDGKKVGYTSTPHPKKAGKTPNTDAKSPKSGGHLSCSSCSKTFNSETGLTLHTKAKHGAQSC
ncbi:unnamed protein product [Lathyrus sativus]|nr:unnamed protein product [Lathyrus sativus]